MAKSTGASPAIFTVDYSIPDRISMSEEFEDDNQWLGFLIVAVLLLLLGALAGFLAQRFIKKGSPPKPEMALEEAQLIKETYSAPAPPATTEARR